MIKRWEVRETRDVARKNQEEKRCPEEPRATRLGGLAESNPKTQLPRPVRAAIGKRGTQFLDRHYAGGRTRRQQQNTAALGSQVWPARA